jgi:hypothetical protein
MQRHLRSGRSRERDLSAVDQRASRDQERQARRILSRCLELIPHYRGLPGPMLESTYENILYHV